jgi:hypothetical protein
MINAVPPLVPALITTALFGSPAMMFNLTPKIICLIELFTDFTESYLLNCLKYKIKHEIKQKTEHI